MQQPHLSGRELEVLALLHDGLSNKKIAFKLGIATDTVKDHTQRIYVKLDVANRAEAAAWYERHYGTATSA